MLRITEMSAHHVDERRIALGRPDRCQMADQPDRSAGDPQTKAEANGGGERANDDDDRSGRAGQKERFCERAMDGCVKAGNGFALVHHTSAPPLNEKKLRKKLEAAKAMDKPNTIWINR